MTVGQKIQKAREKKGWNLSELGRRAGVADVTVARLERMKRLRRCKDGSIHTRTVKALHKIGAALGINLNIRRVGPANGKDGEPEVASRNKEDRTLKRPDGSGIRSQDALAIALLRADRLTDEQLALVRTVLHSMGVSVTAYWRNHKG